MVKYPKTEKYLKNHDVTLVVTFSRKAMIIPFFNSLIDMDLPHEKIDLLIFNNTEKSLLDAGLKKMILLLENSPDINFKSIKYHVSGRTGGRTIMGQDNDNFDTSKLSPIWEMWVDLKKMIKSEVFFLIEDDTIAPPHAFYKLMEGLFTLDKAGFVIGISTGRCPYEWQPTRLGVHYMTMENNKIIERVSLDPDSKGVKEIDGAGVYCFASFTKAWLSGFEGMDKYVYKLPFFGMDNTLTYNIKKQGYKLYADFDVWVDHMQMAGTTLIAFNKKQAVIMADVWVDKYNGYAQGIKLKPETYKKVVKEFK